MYEEDIILNDSQKDIVISYILTHLELLQWRDFLQELLTLPDRIIATRIIATNEYVIETESPLYKGKLIQVDSYLFELVSFEKQRMDNYKVSLVETGILATSDVPLILSTDPLTLNAGIVENYPEGDPIETTIGRVILNYLILSVPFGAIIPYINAPWKSSFLEKTIGDLIVREKVTVDQVNTYIANLYFLGHAPELLCPNVSEKALTTDPQIALRKKVLLEENKEALKNGDAVVMSKIEHELIAMDKEYLKGDSSMDYYLSSKVFGVQRKKLLLLHGMVEAFGDKGYYDFITNSLEEGWTPETFAAIANEIRSGSYARAIETAKGGEDSKFLSRVFSGSRITIDDCHTEHTFSVTFRDDNFSDYVYRNYKNADGIFEPLTIEKAKELIGSVVLLRSPLFCTAPNGYCFLCMGQLFETVRQEVFTTAATAIGAQMTVFSLKKMHGTSVDTVEIKSLNSYVI